MLIGIGFWLYSSHMGVSYSFILSSIFFSAHFVSQDLGCCSCEVVGTLKQLVSLELGECTFRASFGAVLAALPRLQRLRLERGTAECAAPALLRALATLPRLHQLELVNFDVKVC